MENVKINCNVNITGNTYRTEDYSIFKRLTLTALCFLPE